MTPSSWMRPYTMTGGGFSSRKIEQKAPFMAKVIGLMIVQLALTFVVMERFASNDMFQNFAKSHPILLFILFIFPLILILALAFAPLPMYSKLTLFTLFSICLGLLLSITRRLFTPEVIRLVLVVTLGIFVIMFIVGLLLAGFGYDLFWLGAILFFLLLVLLISGIVMLFTRPDQKAIRIRAILAVILFSVYILYDTNQIILRDYAGDYVTAAIDYYLDFVNVFVHLLEVLGNSH